MNFHVLTLFPQMVLEGLNTSITGRAIQQNKIGLTAVDIRDFAKDRRRRVDDYTYGGGAGMLMQAQPVYDAYRSVASGLPAGAKMRVICLTPQGTPFTQSLAAELAECDELVLLCGHYEGIDERVLQEIVTDYISIGDYVLTGGELAAMVVVDAVSRLVPSVLGNVESAEAESFCGNLLEYPQYTRPEEWRKKRVPAVLLGGNRREIDAWRRQEAVKRTRERRPDLYQKYCELEACKTLLLQRKLHHIDMIELIDRGRAVLLACEEHGDAEGVEILLMDQKSRVLFHTWMYRAEGQGKAAREKRMRETVLLRVEELRADPAPMLTLHQREFVGAVSGLGYRLDMECCQAAYTRREKLPVAGLYRPDGGGIRIRTLTPEYLDVAAGVYRTVDDGDYVRDRIMARAMYGAFIGEELAGFIGVHSEGSIGLLEVLPAYRRKKVGMALETYLCNLFVERGRVPYGQVIAGNEVSLALQKRLGLCLSRETVFWMSRKRVFSQNNACNTERNVVDYPCYE